ncbi:MAG: hypothetical protein N2200_08355 [Bacteroidia bacterium]|nr:hypothetical protein [Bacteroidia bacterium]
MLKKQNRLYFGLVVCNIIIGINAYAQNVGIGTASPSERLHINGNLRLDGAFMPGNQAGSKGSILYSDGVNTPPLWLAPPTSAAQILGSTASGTSFIPTWSDGNGLFWRLVGNSGTDINTHFVGTTDNTGLAFRTNNTERMRITNFGNVGIGTTNPDGRLDVRQTTDNEVALFTTYGHVNRIFLRRAQGTISSPSATSGANTVLGRIDAQGYNGTGFTSAARIEMATDAAGGTASDMPGRITFHTTPDGSGTLQERMRIANNGDIFGRFRHISYHKFHNQSWTGNPANTILWIASPGGDATDDWQVNGALPIGGPGFDTEAEAQWVAPYNGRILRIIVRVGNNSGSTPTIRTRGIVLSRNGSLAEINTTGFCLSQDEVGVYECTQNCDVQRGDRIGIGFDLRSGLGGCCGGSCYAEDTHYWVAVVWAFDVWD